MNQESTKDIEIKAATHLALVEIVAGSVGHGFKIPFTGTLLSYYQLYVSLWLIVQKKINSIHVFNIAVIVALLKTLSPMGKKVTPMIAIATQGFLLWLGTAIFGVNVLGLALGAALMVTWSLVQVAIGYVLLYGFDFLRMIEFFQKEITEYIPLDVYEVLFGYLVVKISLAWVVLGFIYLRTDSTQSWLLSENRLQRMKQSMVKPRPNADQSPGVRALRDLFNPFFFISLVLMILFHYYRESSFAEILWFICRTLGLGFLMFYLIRSPWSIRFLIRFFGKSKNFKSLVRKSRRVGNSIFETSRNSDRS